MCGFSQWRGRLAVLAVAAALILPWVESSAVTDPRYGGLSDVQGASLDVTAPGGVEVTPSAETSWYTGTSFLFRAWACPSTYS